MKRGIYNKEKIQGMPKNNKHPMQIMLNFVLRSWGWRRRSVLSGSAIQEALFFISNCFGCYILHVNSIL